MPKTVIFDLDGTIIDSGPGIMNCVRHAFETLHYPVPSETDLHKFVGPPLRESFPQYGIPDDQVEEAVAIFREQYQLTGKFEITPYSGIDQLLMDLQKSGNQLLIATSKPESLAIDILTRIHLAQYFDMICGATMSAERDNKSAVISYLLSQVQSFPVAVMIGDTDFDVIGASSHGIKTIGVSWGYGTVSSMQNAGAYCVVSSMNELYTTIEKMKG